MLNRFCVQAVVGHPLTVYGTGGQTRAMLDIRDTLACVELACEQPGRTRVSSGSSTSSPSRSRCDSSPTWWSRRIRAGPSIDHLDDPRVEKQEHYYRAAHTKLLDLGLVPHLLDPTTLSSILAVVDRHRDRVDTAAIRPTVQLARTASALPTAGSSAWAAEGA